MGKSELELRMDVVGVMRGWVGLSRANGSHQPILDAYNAQKKLPRGYKVQPDDAYCATTVSAAYIKAGLSELCPIECSCSQMMAKAKQRHIWTEADDYTPAPADIIFYDWQDTGKGDNKGNPDHVGVVECCTAGVITVIEGNKGGVVGRRTIPVNGKYIRGYCTPVFTRKAKNESEYVTVAKDVIAGKYGNGEQRREKLSAAGYNYKRVQRLVNILLLKG